MFVDTDGHSNAYRGKISPFLPIFTILPTLLVSYYEYAGRGHLTAHSQYKMMIIKLVSIDQKGKILFLYALEWPPVSTNTKRKKYLCFLPEGQMIFFINFENMIHFSSFSLIGTF